MDPSLVNAPLAGTTIVPTGGLAATVAAWWCGALGADIVLVGDRQLAPGAFAAATATRSLDTVPPAAVVVGVEATDSVGRARVVVTDPTGSDDDWRSAALWARSGLASITRGVWSGEAIGEPQVPVVPVADAIAGSMVALAAISLLVDGDGAGKSIELDELEALCLLPMQPVAVAQLTPDAPQTIDATGVYEAKDGLVYIRAVEPAQWQRLLGHVPGLADVAERVAADPDVLRREQARIDERLAAWVRARPAVEVVQTGQGDRAPVAMLARPADVVDDAQLRARRFFGAGGASARVPWLPTATASGEVRGADGHRVRPPSSLPLDGVRVLDLTWAWAGPFATTLLADLGAEVINIEWDPRPSNLRVQPPFAGESSVNTGGWWSANQRNKLSIGVDLKSDAGRQVVRELAAVSDIAIENFSAGVVDRLGIGFAELSGVNPALVYVSMSAYGGSGPASHYVGYGTQLYASAGFSYLTSATGATPSIMGIPLPDPISGAAAAVGALAHLVGARRTGRGVHLDVSELEATCITLLDGLLGPRHATYHIEHSGGGPCVVSDDKRETVRTIAETLADDWLVRRRFWVEDPGQQQNTAGLRMAGPAFVVNGTRAPVWRGAPSLFADTRLVLRDLLGWDETRIDESSKGLGLRTLEGV